jgi:uncharacterized protein (DUF2267 family)
MNPHAHAFDAEVQEANAWIKEIDQRLNVGDPHAARHALRAVLHALRDRIGPAESVGLAAQLPLVIRGLFFEGWRPAAAATSEGTRAGFLAHVSQCMAPGTLFRPEAAVDAVLHTLWNQLDPGEVAKLRSVLPASIAALWPIAPDAADAKRARPARMAERVS